MFFGHSTSLVCDFLGQSALGRHAVKHNGHDKGSQMPAPIDEAAFRHIESLSRAEAAEAIAYLRDRYGKALRHLGQARELSLTDELTELPNLRYYNEKMASEIGRALRNNHPLSLLLIDIDHFKRVNDKHGHPVGDQILKQVARILKENLKRGGDFVARYGGEEFVVVLPEMDLEEAKRTGEMLRKAVEEATGDTNIPLTVTIGCSALDREHATENRIKKEADEALYYGKRNGRNQVHAYRPEVGIEATLETAPEIEAAGRAFAEKPELADELVKMLQGGQVDELKALLAQDPAMQTTLRQALAELDEAAA